MSSIDRINGLVGSIAVKAPVRIATTTAITLSGLQTIDGVTLAEGDSNLRVLVRAQADSTENGIYDAKLGAWTRAADFDGSRDAVKGTNITVQEGTTYAGYFFVLATDDPVLFGDSAITFTSSANAAASAASAAANAAQTALDAAATAADVITTNANAVSTSADALNTASDAAYVAAQLALVAGSLTFPLDCGLITDSVISNNYDLGTVP